MRELCDFNYLQTSSLMSHISYFDHTFGPICFSQGSESLKMNGRDVIRTRFEPTKRMSTYLVAFVVCEFTYISKQNDKMDVMVIL